MKSDPSRRELDAMLLVLLAEARDQMNVVYERPTPKHGEKGYLLALKKRDKDIARIVGQLERKALKQAATIGWRWDAEAKRWASTTQENRKHG
jgi:hypothetical protein